MANQTSKKKGDKTMHGKYLNPKADLTFKLVFGQHKDLVMSFLNALLPLAEESPITSVEYYNTEMIPENEGKKNSVVDVRCIDSRGRHFLVEMQMNWDDEFKGRVILNASKAVLKQIDKGDIYTKIQPVYSLNILNDSRFQPGADDFYHDYAILNVHHPERSLDYLRFVFVELPKFKPRNVQEKKMAVLWLRFLTEIDERTDQAPAELLESPEISKALAIVEKSAMSEQQLYEYDRFWDQVFREQILEASGFKRGRAEGREVGLAEGRAEGRVEGLAEGEAKKNLENARKMKALNVDVGIISQVTGLSADEIGSL